MRQTEQSVSPMSNEGRNAYVIAHITDAMFELLAEKPIDDISISELVEKAQVGRASFYRNYACKEDVLKKYLRDRMHEWAETWNANNGAPVSEQLRAMISQFESHRSFYQMLNNRGLTYLLKDAFIAICGPKPDCDMVDAYTAAFAAYTLYGWIDTWLQRGMKESADEIADLFQARGL